MPTELTQSQLKELLNYDPDTGVFTWRIPRSRGVRAGDVAGFIDADGYSRIGVYGTQYFAHRLAWLYTYGAWPSNQVDHRDGNPSNNRLKNLREATNAENSRNSKINVGNVSGFRGVHWDNWNKKWRAQIGFGGKRKRLGYFSTPEAASTAYESAASKLFGKFNRKYSITQPLNP